MPKTKFQEFIFAIMMSLTMAYGMELYNLALLNGGLSERLFIEVCRDVFLMAIVVFCVERFFGGKIAHHIAFQFMDPHVDKPIFITLAIQCCTVLIMSPTMSLIATLLFKQPGSHILSIWIQTLVFNFPFAFFYQVFFAGPFVRSVFKFVVERKTQIIVKS